MTGSGSILERRQLWIAVISAIVVFVAVVVMVSLGSHLPPLPTVAPSISATVLTDPPTPSRTPSATPSVTQTGTPFIDYTASPIPTPIRGVVKTNVPNSFIVEHWHDDRVVCGRRFNYQKINITGVDIFGADPPFHFTFSQSNKVIARVTVMNTGTVEFSQPVLVKKGSYVHVTVTFDSTDGGASWSDDLFYPVKDNDCPNH